MSDFNINYFDIDYKPIRNFFIYPKQKYIYGAQNKKGIY